jgi:NADPH:quinone reductase-like Zn-dependent oxidoreductase
MNFEVRRDDLRTTRIADVAVPTPEPGQVVLRVSRFALTANNVTYAVFGDAMAYWQFFPADEEGWGRVPVWGFADVEASQVDGIDEGDRFYGYLPMASHLVVAPEHVDATGFVEAAAHRAVLPPIYNRYERMGWADDADREGKHALLRPLFATAFLLDDWLADNDMFGASSVVLASASSKTALGLAYLLNARGGSEVVGLTSPGNADFVASVGYYDQTVAYGNIDQLNRDTPTAFVDMAGGGQVLGDVHRHFTESLKQSALVGATHWEESAPPSSDMPGPAPTFFFAPDHATRRQTDWGAGGLSTRLDAAMDAFVASTDAWLTVDERPAPEALEASWLEVLEGRAAPAAGIVLSLR